MFSSVVINNWSPFFWIFRPTEPAGRPDPTCGIDRSVDDEKGRYRKLVCYKR